MFGIVVICYLFLGGLSGGLCVVAAASGLSMPAGQLRAGPAPEQRRLMAASFAASAGGLVLSALLLLADAGNVTALKYLILSPRFGYLAVGAWAIALGAVLSATLAVLWRAPAAAWGVKLVRFLLSAECVVGAVIVLYTGLFLAGMTAVALWATPWLVALFVTSSLSCALAAFVALAGACGLSSAFARWLRLLVQIDVLVVATEAACAVGFLLAAFQVEPASAVAAAEASATRLVAGDLSVVWWGGFVLAGIAVPLALELCVLGRSRALPPYSLQAMALALCAFVGGLSMRYCVVMAGMHPVLGF